MAKSKQRMEAMSLRKSGMSVKSIAENLGVSKSSVSTWCRDIELTEEQIRRLHKNMVVGGYSGRSKGARLQRDRKRKKIAHYEAQAREEIHSIKKRELLMVGLGLYWGEGGKTSSGVRMFNSDPRVIGFMMRWFREIFDVVEGDFSMYVTINGLHRERLGEVICFWSGVTKIPVGQFGKPILIKSKNKKIYENHSEHYGTLCIRIRKSSELLYKIKGLIVALYKAG